MFSFAYCAHFCHTFTAHWRITTLAHSNSSVAVALRLDLTVDPVIRAPASPTATADPLPCYCSPLQHTPAQVEEISSPHDRASDLTVNDPCIYACDIQNVYCKRPSPACSLRRHQSTHCIKHVDPARICTVVVEYYSRNQNQYCTVLILVSPFHSTDRLHLHAVLTKRPQFWVASLDIWRESLGR